MAQRGKRGQGRRTHDFIRTHDAKLHLAHDALLGSALGEAAMRGHAGKSRAPRSAQQQAGTERGRYWQSAAAAETQSSGPARALDTAAGHSQRASLAHGTVCDGCELEGWQTCETWRHGRPSAQSDCGVA